MNVLLFGATGMVGQGVLRECLLDPGVERVLSIGRSVTGRHHEKLREIEHKDLFNLSAIEGHLAGFNACFFCLGVSSAGMAEEQYQQVTYGITMTVAQTLAKLNPKLTFIYVSGMGTDSSEHGRSMWARVKGKTENALLQLPIETYMFRPGLIAPLHGVRSKTWLYRIPYMLLAPLLPLLSKLFPKYVTTTEQIGRAMIKVAAQGADQRILESADINRL